MRRGLCAWAGVCALAAGALLPGAADGQAARGPRLTLKMFSLRRAVPRSWAQPQLWDIVRGSDAAMWFGVTGSCGGYPCSGIGRITSAGRTRLFVLPHHDSVASLTRGHDGNVWFAAVSADGLSSVVGRLTTAGRMTIVATGLSPLVNEMTPGPGGDIWIGDQSNIFRVARTGTVMTFPLPSPHTAFGVVTGPDGDLWFTSELTVDGPRQDSIGRLTPRGAITFFTIPTENSAPDGIAVGPDHNVWFGEGAGRIGRITRQGRIREFGTGYRGSEISAVTAGPRRSVWFMDRGRRAIGQITMSGHVHEVSVPAPRDDSELFALAPGPGSSLWFTVSSGLQIGRLVVG